jgi:hypothetical protein
MHLGSARALGAALALVCGLTGPGAAEQPAQFIGQYHWTNPAGWFGGFSALSIQAQGTQLIAVSDAGRLVRGTVSRTKGQITGVNIRSTARLPDMNGRPLRKKRTDAEGLAIGANGTLYISFEQFHLVRSYSSRIVPLGVIEPLPAFKAFRPNAGFEALAIDRHGHLFALPERPRSARTGFQVYRHDGQRWTHAFRIRKQQRYLAVSAEFGPDGQFYLLERRITLLGFQSRIRRWTLVDGQPQNETIILKTNPGQFDNLEGMSLWRDIQGRLRITLVSDDNFRSFQTTELVEFAINE